jgi:hypothetical protein
MPNRDITKRLINTAASTTTSRCKQANCGMRVRNAEIASRRLILADREGPIAHATAQQENRREKGHGEESERRGAIAEQAHSVADDIVVLARGCVRGQFSGADVDVDRVTRLFAEGRENAGGSLQSPKQSYSKGIGRELIAPLEQAGAMVVPTARSDGDLASLGPHALWLNVRDLASIKHMVSAVVAKHGRIDVLVNNASDLGLGVTPNVPSAEWRRAA